MANEKIYFYSFVYMLLLVWGSFMALAGWRRLIRSGRNKLAWCLLLGVIFIDLSVYGSQAIHYVTQQRGRFKFSEKKSPYVLAERRSERLFFDDLRFRYFRPALHKVYTALDLSTLDYFVVTHGMGVSPSLILSQILDGDFPLQREACVFNVGEFISQGRSNYDHWDNMTKIAFLGVMETVLHDMMIQRNFYSLFNGFEELAKGIEENIRVGYRAALDGSEWEQKQETIGGVERLVQLSLGVKSGNAIKTTAGDRNFWNRVAEHGQRFRLVPVSEYFSGFWHRYRLRDVNSFVRFKDYDRIANLFERPLVSSKVAAIRSRIRRDLGISSDIVRFYPEAKALPSGEYYSRLSRGLITDESLYLETDQPLPAQQDKGQGQGFSYTISAYGPNRLKLSLHAPDSGYLYFSDGFDRHWKAYVDGTQTQVYKANGAFKAAAVPAGAHHLEFVYDPVFFRLSLWIYYILTLACIAFLVAYPRFRKINN